jgi:hypothetical protein
MAAVIVRRKAILAAPSDPDLEQSVEQWIARFRVAPPEIDTESVPALKPVPLDC